MLVLSEGKYTVMDKTTKEIISVHPFDSDYTQKKAKQEAIESNNRWKESKA